MSKLRVASCDTVLYHCYFAIGRVNGLAGFENDFQIMTWTRLQMRVESSKWGRFFSLLSGFENVIEIFEWTPARMRVLARSRRNSNDKSLILAFQWSENELVAICPFCCGDESLLDNRFIHRCFKTAIAFQLAWETLVTASLSSVFDIRTLPSLADVAKSCNCYDFVINFVLYQQFNKKSYHYDIHMASRNLDSLRPGSENHTISQAADYYLGVGAVGLEKM